MGTAYTFAINRNNFTVAQLGYFGNPAQKTGLELLPVQLPKHAPEGIVRWDSARQRQKSCKPILLFPNKLCHPFLVTRPTQYCTDRYRQHVQQLMPPVDR